MCSIVIGFNESLRVLQNGIFLFHHTIGWQAAFGLTHTHAAASGHKTHANFLGCCNAVVQLHAVGVDVQVVAAGGAARQQQFGHGRLCAGVNHVGLQACPDGIEASEPAEQLGVLHGRNGACQTLAHVMVRVDHARYHHMMLGIDHLVCCLRQAVCGTDGFDAIVSDKNRGIAKFIARVVERGDGVSVVDEQGGHVNDFARRN